MLDKNTKVVADLGRLIKLPETTGDGRQPSPDAIAAADAEALLALFFGTVATPGTAYTHADLELRQKDARRAAACINACRGISTEDLEQGKFILLPLTRWHDVANVVRLADAATVHTTPKAIIASLQDGVAQLKSLAFEAFAAQGTTHSFGGMLRLIESSPALTPALRLQEFAPGEGSRFLVGVARLPLADALLIGGTADADTVLVLFGTENPGGLAAYWFQATPGKRDTLSLDYFQEKMPGLATAALTAGHHVVAHLLGREAWGAKYAPDLLGWSPDWRAQLETLRALAIGKFDIAGAASSEGDKPAALSAAALTMPAEGEVSNAQ